MSTRAHVGIKLENGNVRYIYNHFDGYPSNLGKILENHYNTRESIEALIAMGDASSIGNTLETSRFYCRDGKEDLNINETTKEEFLNNCAVDFKYLWNGTWMTQSSC